MTADPVAVREDAGLLEVTTAMSEHTVRRIPVVIDEGALVGIVTLDDLLVSLSTELPNLAAVAQAESPPY